MLQMFFMNIIADILNINSSIWSSEFEKGMPFLKSLQKYTMMLNAMIKNLLVNMNDLNNVSIDKMKWIHNKNTCIYVH